MGSRIDVLLKIGIMDKLALQIKMTWVLGLLVDCPLGKALESCPASDIRKLTLEERVALVKKMEENQLQEIIMRHKQCFREREKV